MELYILNNLPWFWLAVLVVSLVIEGMTMMLTSIWCAIAAFVLIFVSTTPLSFKWQLLLFALISLVLVIFTRPFAVKKLRIKKEATNSDALIGKHVLVTKKITPLEKGMVKLNGVEWSASSNDGTTIERGTEVEIVKIEGVTVFVKTL